MEQENIINVKSKFASRIPLPQEPLPPIPVSLRLKSSGHGTENKKRCPLKTLNHQAGSSEQNSLRTKKGKPLRIDARRARQDSGKSADVSSSVEHNRVKNVKKKVESPHSKELQGLSPEKAPKPGPPDNLLRKTYMHSLNRQYSMEMLHYLMEKEKKTSRKLLVNNNIRAFLVSWLMRINGPDGNPAVVQSACLYLDMIVSKEDIRNDKIQLIAATCYWIALKFHGGYMSKTKLAQFSDKAFEPKDLVEAENLFWEELRFPTHPVVAQDFLPYFAWQCDCKHPGEIEEAASFICLSGLVVNMGLAGAYPSVIAAAAVRNALMLLKRTKLMPKLLNCPIYREAESKGGDFQFQATCLAQRNAIRIVASSEYELRAPYEHYGAPPFYLAIKIVKAAMGEDLRSK